MCILTQLALIKSAISLELGQVPPLFLVSRLFQTVSTKRIDSPTYPPPSTECIIVLLTYSNPYHSTRLGLHPSWIWLPREGTLEKLGYPVCLLVVSIQRGDSVSPFIDCVDLL